MICTRLRILQLRFQWQAVTRNSPDILQKTIANLFAYQSAKYPLFQKAQSEFTAENVRPVTQRFVRTGTGRRRQAKVSWIALVLCVPSVAHPTGNEIQIFCG